MHFKNIDVFFIFFLLPVLIILFVRSFKMKERLISQFCSSDLAARLIPGEIKGRQKAKSVLLVFAVFFILVAFMEPRWGFQWEDIKRRGVDIIIAIDVSESMLAEDVQPNRLERAKREINDLLQMVEGDRIGLVAFAGTSFVQCPLTLDYSAVQLFLDYIQTDLIPVPGTAIGAAIQASTASFKQSGKGKSKALILITDGEDHEGDPLKAAKEAKKAGVRIFPIGIGKEGGAPIPDSKGGFKKNRAGEVIVTKLDEITLQRIALETGGSYVRSVTGDLDLEQIYIHDIKEKMEKKEFKTTRKKRWEERFQWFIFIAFVLLGIECLISEKKRIG